jgi:hypothetical protein
MVNSSNVWRPWRIWWTGSLALMACLGAGSGSLRSEERLAAKPAVSQETGRLPARIHGQDLTEAWDAHNAKLRYLIEELITLRFESARLNIEGAEARAESAEIKEVSRQQAELLTALMAVLATRDRKDATLRSETTDLRQRLEAAQAELQRERVENSRLAAELAAAHKAADSATMMAMENLAVIEAQIGVLSAAHGNAALERAKQPAELLSAVWVEMLPAIPRPKPRLETTQ